MMAFLPQLLDLIKQAGEAICAIYDQAPDKVEIQQKADESPLTNADLISHQILTDGLTKLTPPWPILSEESQAIDFSERQAWKTYWLIDPLDGTREFLARTDEFTINVALIENHIPILGIIYAPVSKVFYFADQHGAFKQLVGETAQKISARKPDARYPIIVASRRHAQNEKLQQFFQSLPNYERVSVGSALKFCLVAEGRADIYPRFGPTSEWDTAAGQCILEAAGGKVLDTNGNPLRYNMRPDLINPFFIATGVKP